MTDRSAVIPTGCLLLNNIPIEFSWWNNFLNNFQQNNNFIKQFWKLWGPLYSVWFCKDCKSIPHSVVLIVFNSTVSKLIKVYTVAHPLKKNKILNLLNLMSFQYHKTKVNIVFMKHEKFLSLLWKYRHASLIWICSFYEAIVCLHKT